MSKVKTLGLFSGGGGLDLGFSAANFNLVLSSDIDSHSCKTLKLNQSKQGYLKRHPILCEDIRNLTYKSLKSELGSVNIDFIIGGPPCQAFSVFGKRLGLNDPRGRGDLVYEYARLLKEIEPEAFLFENVAGLKTIHEGALYKDLLETLSINGKYTISAHEYEVADFGIPQFRRRVFFIGSKSGKTIPQMESTHTAPNSLFNGHKPYKTVEAILKGLPLPKVNWNDEVELNAHVGRKHSERIIQRYESLKFGERDPKTRINKLNPNRPSFTIIVGSDAGGGKGHVHPYQPRELTPRESARIQTFPDWWEFHGTGRHIIRQVGNAVPPLFAGIIANYISKELFGTKKNLKYEELILRLGLDFLNNGD